MEDEMKLKDMFQNIDKLVVSDSIKGYIIELNNYYNHFMDNKDRYNSNYIKTWENQFNGLENILSQIKTIDEESSIVLLFSDSLEKALQNYLDSFSSLDSLEMLKYTDRNVIVIGANGSGKTTFLNYIMKKNMGIDIEYYPSERLFITQPNETYPMSYEVFKNGFESNRSQMLNKDHSSRGHYFSRDFNYTITLLIKQHNNELQQGKQTTDTTAYSIIKKWNELIKTRSLVIENNELFGLFEGVKYPVNDISSGEKSILYFLVNILLRDKKQYYIIDEPEISLNTSIVSQLWTYIEEARPESIFVYLTHDSSFVMTRNNTDKYWMKGYLGFQKWDIVEMPVDDYLPEALMVQLLGTKQPILFVESEDKSKYDYKLYSIMFPEFKVIPSGGSEQVKFKTKAYNNLKISKAYGIIDCDYHEESILDGYIKHNVHHAPFFEVENLLVCSEIIDSVLNYHKYSSNEIEVEKKMSEILTDLAKNLESKKIEISYKMAISRVINRITNMDFSVNRELGKVQETLKLFGDTEFDKIQTECLNTIDNVLTNPNHNMILRYLDDKNNILKRVGNMTSMKNYQLNILNYLQNVDKDIIPSLRKTYFPTISIGH